MKKTNQLIRTLYYVFSFCVMLYSNNTRAQDSKINSFFNNEKLYAYKYCHNELKTDEDYLRSKSKKDTVLIKLLESECDLIKENYNIYIDNTLKLINQNTLNSNNDFIIINMDIKSVHRSNPVLTVMKFRNKEKYQALHNDYKYDEITNRSYRVTDSIITIDNVEKKFKMLENYFYNKGHEDKIFIDQKKAIKKYNFQNISTYFVVARIAGKIITKKIYFADDTND